MNWNCRVEAELLHPARGHWQWCWEALGNCHRDVELQPRKHSPAYHKYRSRWEPWWVFLINNYDLGMWFGGTALAWYECDFGVWFSALRGYIRTVVKLDLGVVTWYRGKREATGQAPAHSVHTRTLKNYDFLKKYLPDSYPGEATQCQELLRECLLLPQAEATSSKREISFSFPLTGRLEKWKRANISK